MLANSRVLLVAAKNSGLFGLSSARMNVWGCLSKATAQLDVLRGISEDTVCYLFFIKNLKKIHRKWLD